MTRGRPRKIDPNQALNAAMITFWQNGYDGTSMADLVNATGMAKPGLYANFGDKQGIYSKALDHYVMTRGMPLAKKILSFDKPVKEVMSLFLNAVIDNVSDEKLPKGCFLANTLVEGEGDRQFLEQLGRKYNDMRRAGLCNYFKKAQTEGKLAKEVVPSVLAEFFLGQILAISVMHRAGVTRDVSRKFVETALNVLRD